MIITTPTAAKVYDTKPLTAEGSISGLVEGETVSFITTGTQTEVGTSENTFKLEWTGSAKESNYTIKSVTTGKLKVVPQSIDPESPNYRNAEVNDPENFKYDGSFRWRMNSNTPRREIQQKNYKPLYINPSFV